MLHAGSSVMDRNLSIHLSLLGQDHRQDLPRQDQTTPTRIMGRFSHFPDAIPSSAQILARGRIVLKGKTARVTIASWAVPAWDQNAHAVATVKVPNASVAEIARVITAIMGVSVRGTTVIMEADAQDCSAILVVTA